MAFRASTTAVATARRFGTDACAGVAIIFALSLPVVTIALGGAVDLARAHAARQTLSEVASLACQFASLPGIVGVGDFAGGVNAAGQTAYRTKVNDFIARTLRMQRFEYPQTTDDPFTFVPHGQAEIHLTASVPTAFLAIARLPVVSVDAAVHCFDQPPASEDGGASIARVTDGATSDPPYRSAPSYREQLAQRRGPPPVTRFCNPSLGPCKLW